jgi:DNA-directed RNA polymerase specialized sigma24 family protein
MSDTDGPIRQPELAPDCLAASTLRDTYYRPLVRLAALLTGDPDMAETVAREALGALRPRSPFGREPSSDALRYLQQQVLLRSRRNRSSASRLTSARRPGHDAQPLTPTDAADFASLPVVRALQDLPRRGREVVVLTHYLDLSEHQAARVAGVTPAALRRILSQAMRTLDDRLGSA